MKTSLKDVMDRDDGPFWDRMRQSPGYASLERHIGDLMLKAQIEEWGDRCPDFDPECPACAAWKEFDARVGNS